MLGLSARCRHRAFRHFEKICQPLLMVGSFREIEKFRPILEGAYSRSQGVHPPAGVCFAVWSHELRRELSNDLHDAIFDLAIEKRATLSEFAVVFFSDANRFDEAPEILPESGVPLGHLAHQF